MQTDSAIRYFSKPITKFLLRLSAVLAIHIPALPVVFAGPSVYPVGTTIYDPSRAYNSYVLFTGGDNVARLIDLNGNVVHAWKDAAQHSTFIDPAAIGGQRGHVFVTLESMEGRGTNLIPGQVAGRVAKTIGELDWNSNVIWKFGEKAPGGLALQHHDWARLPNGNTAVLANLSHPIAGFKLPQLLDDVVYEVNASGEIIWQWIAGDHLDELGFTAEELKLVRNTDDPDYLHVNNLKVIAGDLKNLLRISTLKGTLL